MADIDRRTVKPAFPDAYIPDPDHGGPLVADGREVVWNHYWQGHLDKGNIVEVQAPAPAAPAAPSDPAIVKPTPQPAPAAQKAATAS